MKLKVGFFAFILFLAIPVLSSAQQWVYPVIEGYGGAHPLPDSKVQPDKKLDYKIIFDLTKDSQKDSVNSGLFHIARLLNVYASAGVNPEQLDLVGIFHGNAGKVVLDNENYKKKFKTDNPNIDLISKLKNAGVKFFVCGQTLEEKNFDHNWVNPDVDIALSALTVLPTYQLKGYALMTY